MWASRTRAGIVVATAALAAACTGPAPSDRGAIPDSPSSSGAPEQGGTYKVGRTYVANGESYTPTVDYDYSETGIASWYGSKFAGRRTANGEIFDPSKLTAAHRTLPLPSMVRVTNLENGRSVRVRVNDRGPFAKGRIIDVSRRAAAVLGFKEQGTARVRVKILEEPSRRMARAAKAREEGGSRPKVDAGSQVASAGSTGSSTSGEVGPDDPESDSAGSNRATRKDAVQPKPTADDSTEAERTNRVFVQAGAFVMEANARSIRRRLEHLGNPFIDEAMVNGQQFFRVRFGPLNDERTVDRLLAQLAQEGVPRAAVVRR